MTNEQIKVFKELLADESFKGKKQLQHLLWMNTNTPKFKVGDCFVISDKGHWSFGYPVKDFNAKVTRIYSWKDSEEWQYELTLSVSCGDNVSEIMSYKSESELLNAKQCTDNKNILGDAKDNHSISIDA
jgi:hypothetical protein